VARRGVLILALASVAWQPAFAQKTKPVKRASRVVAPKRPAPMVEAVPPAIPSSPDSLTAISRRGRALAVRDSIGWLGADAMTSLSIPADSIRRLIVRHTETGWEVASGVLSDDGSAYLVAEIATPGIQSPWASTLFDPPQPDTSYFARAARAIETSIAMFHRPAARPYIATAIPSEDGPWWFVYLYPAPLVSGSWPRGGDMRFRVSADGRVITESRHLHDSITEYSVRTARPASALFPREPLVSGDTPEDTDVFHVIQRRPAIPELMLAGKHRYRIDVDGSIKLLPNN
jgi:hypothetical protein